MSGYQVGQIIQLADGQLATVRYVGQTGFAPGDWIGVELEDLNGKNDGSVKGERYFDCEMGRGMFLRETAITAIIGQAPAPKSAAPAKKAGRPSSVVSSGLGRRTSIVPDMGVSKRMSMNAASPSPAARGSRPSSMLRVGVTSVQIVYSFLTSNSLPQNHLRNSSQRPHPLPQRHELAPLPILEHLL
jgi:dynactin 1